jgi:hypothetical protein
MIEPGDTTGGRRPRLRRAGLLLAGLLLEHAILFGTSLAGATVLLPLDVLARPGFYLPRDAQAAAEGTHNPILSDLVLSDHMDLRFACAELRAGRLPLWNPNNYAGTPFATFGKYSPFHLLYYLFPSPVTLAWMQLLKGLVAGVGAYLFFRRVLRVAFWPAAVGAWCYPVTGFFVLWQGYAVAQAALWLPWVLLATDACVRRPRGMGGVALALLTCLTVLSGQVGVAGQVLLCSGLYALWCLGDQYRRRLLSWPAAGAAAAAACAWALGLVLSAPYLLPLAEYARSGERITARAGGKEERPPGKPAGLRLTVLPFACGSHLDDCVYTGPGGNHLEGPAAAYTGLLVTLVLAPLGWCSRRHRSVNAFWAVLAVVGLGWTLGIPGLVGLFRLPLLNLLSVNRFVFASSFAVLATAVAGLDVLGGGDFSWQRWSLPRFVLPVALLAALGSWSLGRYFDLPQPVRDEIDQINHAAEDPYRAYQLGGAALCGLGLALWGLAGSPAGRRAWFAPLVGLAAVGDLVVFAYGVSAQCDPALYYPPVAALTRLAEAPAGRLIGIDCFPPNLNQAAGLRDVRGYDGVDPHHIVRLLYAVRDRRHQSPGYALTQWYWPRLPAAGPGGDVRVPPVLDLLGVRYVIFYDRPRGVRLFHAQKGYYVAENRRALPRVSVPRRVKAAPAEDRLLALLAAADFDPRQTAYVDGEAALPGECRGTAAIVDEVPTRVRVAVDMRTPGLLLLADQWYDGWHAYVGGRPAPVLRADYAVRGVVVPAGRGVVEFRYEPAGVMTGFRLLVGGLLTLLGWAVLVGWLARKARARAAACEPRRGAPLEAGGVRPLNVAEKG